MFARYYVDLAIPFEEMADALTDDPQSWVPGLLSDAEARGQHLLVEVGFEVETHRLEREVDVTLGDPHRFGTTLVLPMSWRATGASRLFPNLDADIEVAALGPERTQLSISARYRPPMGALGRVIDRALLHRVAEATIKDFLDGVSERLRLRQPATG